MRTGPKIAIVLALLAFVALYGGFISSWDWYTHKGVVLVPAVTDKILKTSIEIYGTIIGMTAAIAFAALAVYAFIYIATSDIDC